MRDELKFALKCAQEAPREQLPRFLGELEEVRCIAFGRLFVAQPVTETGPDRLLAIDEASRRLGVSKDYLYRNNKDLPFTRRIGRKLLFSSQGIESYVNQNDRMTPRRHSGNIPPPVTCAARGRR